MESLKRFMLSKPRAQRVMLIAITVLFVSQFFPYFNDSGGGFMSIDADFNSTLYLRTGRIGSGWQLHSLAFILIPVLAFAFLRDDIMRRFTGPRFDRFGYWAAVVFVFLCFTPAAPFRAFGASLGLAALAVAIIAAVMNGRARKAAPPAP